MSQPEFIEPLTAKELEVLYLMLNPEMDLSDIARQLVVNRGTITAHTVSIYAKLGVGSRFEAVCRYAQLNMDYRRKFFDFLS